jgi:hypothetical protein
LTAPPPVSFPPCDLVTTAFRGGRDAVGEVCGGRLWAGWETSGAMGTQAEVTAGSAIGPAVSRAFGPRGQSRGSAAAFRRRREVSRKVPPPATISPTAPIARYGVDELAPVSARLPLVSATVWV